MTLEITGTYLKSLAAESVGWKDYKWALSRLKEESPNAHPFLLNLFAGIHALNGFEMPLNLRFLRKGISFESINNNPDSTKQEFAKFGFVHQSLVVRELVGMAISIGAFFVVGNQTGDWLLATGTHITSRFILNGILHTEMNSTLNR